MVLTAELGTLTAVGTWFFYNRPGVINKTRYNILFYREFGYPPGVNDIIGMKQKTYFFINRQDDWIIDFEQVIFIACRILYHVPAALCERTDDLNIFVDVIVFPFPLDAGDLEVDIGIGLGVFQP